MTTRPDGVPRAMLHNMLHNKVLHDRVILLNVNMQDIPHVDPAERIFVEPLSEGFYRIVLNYGFKGRPEHSAGARKAGFSSAWRRSK